MSRTLRRLRSWLLSNYYLNPIIHSHHLPPPFHPPTLTNTCLACLTTTTRRLVHLGRRCASVLDLVPLFSLRFSFPICLFTPGGGKPQHPSTQYNRPGPPPARLLRHILVQNVLRTSFNLSNSQLVHTPEMVTWSVPVAYG